MFPITLTLHNIAQLNAVMAALATGALASGVAAGENPAALVSNDKADIVRENQMQAPGKPSAAPTAPSQPTAEAAPSPSAQPAAAPESKTTATEQAAAAPSAPADDMPYTVLQKAVNERVAKFGKDALLAIANKHGAATFKALDPSKWAAAHADVVALG